MGVRVEAGGGRRREGRMARACGGAAPVSCESGQCRAARRRALSPPSAVCASSRAQALLCDSRAALTRVVVLYDGTA